MRRPALPEKRREIQTPNVLGRSWVFQFSWRGLTALIAAVLRRTLAGLDVDGVDVVPTGLSSPPPQCSRAPVPVRCLRRDAATWTWGRCWKLAVCGWERACSSSRRWWGFLRRSPPPRLPNCSHVTISNDDSARRVRLTKFTAAVRVK